MPDPVWTAQYSYGSTPEANGFTRTLYRSPVVTVTTAGPTAGRKVSVNSDAGDCVFVSSNVPSLDGAVGATAEMIVAVTGAGDAGVELTFLDHAVGVMVYADRVDGYLCQDAEPGEIDFTVPTANNGAAVTVRLTFDGTDIRVYRAGVQIYQHALPVCSHPTQRVLWWGEAGGVQTFTGLKYYLGGAVPPG